MKQKDMVKIYGLGKYDQRSSNNQMTNQNKYMVMRKYGI